MPNCTRWYKISGIEVRNARKAIRQLAEHTAEQVAITCAPYTTERNLSTGKSTLASPEKDDTEDDVYPY